MRLLENGERAMSTGTCWTHGMGGGVHFLYQQVLCSTLQLFFLSADPISISNNMLQICTEMITNFKQ